MLVSIITPCLNRRSMVADAVESVLTQDHPAVEHIIVDGGSTDGTLDVLARYPHLRVVSEPDRGLYDAINKGIRLARGEILGHLNSDDLYRPNVLGAVAEAFARDAALESVAGGAEVFADENGHGGGDGRVLARINDPGIKQLSIADIVRGVPLTNARFFRRSLYDRVGGYDIRFPIVADRDFLLRAVLAGMRRAVLPQIVYRYRSHDGSLTFGTAAARERYLREFVTVAAIRLAETAGDPAAASAYRRWHAWAAGYLAADLIRQGRVREAWRPAADAFARDAWWTGRFALQLPAHALGRQARRWSDV